MCCLHSAVIRICKCGQLMMVLLSRQASCRFAGGTMIAAAARPLADTQTESILLPQAEPGVDCTACIVVIYSFL
jgi:hypothetical protein